MLGYTGGAPREQTQQAGEELRERDNLWTNTFIGDLESGANLITLVIWAGYSQPVYWDVEAVIKHV